MIDATKITIGFLMQFFFLIVVSVDYYTNDLLALSETMSNICKPSLC